MILLTIILLTDCAAIEYISFLWKVQWLKNRHKKNDTKLGTAGISILPCLPHSDILTRDKAHFSALNLTCMFVFHIIWLSCSLLTVLETEKICLYFLSGFFQEGHYRISFLLPAWTTLHTTWVYSVPMKPICQFCYTGWQSLMASAE